MAIFTTKINLNNSKYYQITGDTLSLSGTTFVGKILYVKDVSSTYSDRSIIDKGYLDYRLLTFSGSSSVFVSGATNGLTLLDKKIKLGGTLINNTDIDTANKTFRLGELSNFGPYLYLDNANFQLTNFYNGTDYSTIATNNSSIYLTTTKTGKTATYILNQNGLQSLYNYFSGNTNNPRWIPDKEYVDLNGSSNASNGLSKIDKNIVFGGTLTGNTTINQNNNNILFNNGRIISSGQTGQGFDSYSNYKLSGSTILNTGNNGFICGNIAVGYQTLNNNNTGCKNIAVGYQTLSGNTSGYDNVAIGYQSLYSNINGSNNIALGINALYKNINGRCNTAIGYNSLYQNTNNNCNIAIGYNSLSNACNSISSIGIGAESLMNNNAFNNIGIGIGTLQCNCSGNDNIAIGNNSMCRSNSGCENIGIGIYTLYSNIGCNNIGLGSSSLQSNINGCDNIAIGINTLNSNTCGYNNIAYGSNTLISNIDGCNNTALGFASLCTNLSGCNNIGLGFSAGKYEIASNSVYIDNIDRTSITLGKSNSLLYGVTNTIPSAQTLTTNSKFTATYGINIPAGNTYNINNNNIQNHYKHTTITGNTTLTGNEYVVYGNNSTIGYRINLPLNPINETAFKIKDIGGNALSNNITISGNTHNIDGSSFTTINTNYGAIELIFNSSTSKWYTLSFVN